MEQKRPDSRGISEIQSVILMVILVVALAAIVFALVSGSLAPYLQKTSLVAATAGTVKVPLDATSAMQIPYAQPISGDKYYISGQSDIPSGSPVASFVLRDPTGNSYTVKSSSVSPQANQYGTPLFLYQKRDLTYWVTDSLSLITNSASTQLKPLSRGEWTVTMIDNTANVPLTEMKVTIGSDSSTNNVNLPNYTLCLTGVCGSQGSGISNSSYNVTYGTGPGGMTAYHFNGINSNVTIPNNPDLTFTGDMTLSLWMKPDTSGSYPDSWHTVIGKGQLVGGVEDDNYQLMTIGRDLYFEWNDATDPTIHYHVSTTGLNPLQNNQWGYVSVVVNGGTAGGVSLYNNGQLVPVNYYPNNHPYPWEGAAMVIPPVVNLKPNSLDTHVGVQASPTEPYFFEGDIGNLAVYNRALTAQEMQNNNSTYQA